MNKHTANLLGILCAFAVSLLGCTLRSIAADAVKPQPIELPGIENAFRVTDRILAGSQPKSDVSFAALAKTGVKTIISVDGNRPGIEAVKNTVCATCICPSATTASRPMAEHTLGRALASAM